MKRSLALTAAALVIVALGSVAAVARPQQATQQRWMGMGPGGPGPFGMLQRLNLSDDQRTQIRAILDEQRNARPNQKLMDLQKQLHEAIFADTPDQSKIAQLKTAITAAQAGALNDHVAVQLKIAQILTPEQRQQAREFQGRGPGRGLGRGRGMGGFGPGGGMW